MGWPAVYNFVGAAALWRGADRELVFRTPAIDWTGHTFRFTATVESGAPILKALGAGVSFTWNASTQRSELTVTLAPADTRRLPLGMISEYELEARATATGVETVIVAGRIEARGGINADG